MGMYSDLSLNTGDYIPQYAGAPLAEIEKTADTLAGRHYQNIASATQLELFANQLKSKLLPGAKSYVDEHINSLGEALESMAKSGGENSTARINALARTLHGDQGLLNAVQRTEEYNKQTALIDELTAKGQIPLFNKERRQQLEQAAPGDSVYNQPYSMSVEPYRDPTPEMEAVWKIINPDSYESEIKAAMNTSTKELLGKSLDSHDPDLPLFFESITKAGISGEKIYGMLDNAWSTYQNSQSFKQQTGDLVNKTPKQVKKEFYKQGLLRVYQNIQRDYKTTPAWAGKSTQTPDPDTIIVPMEASVRDNLEKTKSVIPGIIDKALLRSEEKVLSGQLQSLSMTSKIVGMTPKDQKKKEQIENRLKEIEVERSRTKEEVEQQELDIFKIALDITGVQPKQPVATLGKKKTPPVNVANMTDKELKEFMKTPEGKSALDSYKDQYMSLRYNNAFVNVPLSKDASETNERFIQKTIQFRPIMSVDGSEYYTNILDENRLPQDSEMKKLNQAIFEGKFEYVGTATPRNLFAKMAGETNFVKPIRIRVQDPDNLGVTKDYYLGQLAEATQPADINENILWERATARPGAFNNVGSGYQIMAMPTQTQRDKLYPKYSSVELNGQMVTVPQERFINNPDAVLLQDKEGKILPFANYTAAATYLATKGIHLQLK